MNTQDYYERKLTLVLLSGGADSTMLAYQLLQTSPIDILYIEGNQGPDKIAAEKAAVVKIVAWLNANCNFKIRYNDCATSTINPIGEYTFGQVAGWLFGALFNSRISVRESVNMSYICGDQFAYHAKTLAEIWDKLFEISQRTKVPLQFPLIMYDKVDIYKGLPPDLLKLIWVCELPAFTKAGKAKHCGKCPACKAQSITLQFLLKI